MRLGPPRRRSSLLLDRQGCFATLAATLREVEGSAWQWRGRARHIGGAGRRGGRQWAASKDPRRAMGLTAIGIRRPAVLVLTSDLVLG